MDFGKLTSQIPGSMKDDLLKKASDTLQEKLTGKNTDTPSVSPHSESVAASDTNETEQATDARKAVSSTRDTDAVGSAPEDVDADSSADADEGAA